jgi:hypothetical protein
MKHAGPATLAKIPGLLAALRANPALRESRPGVFDLRSRAFLHFHDDPAGVFADVRFDTAFVRMRVTSESEQADLLDRIDACLESVGSRAPRRASRSHRRGSRRGDAAEG